MDGRQRFALIASMVLVFMFDNAANANPALVILDGSESADKLWENDLDGEVQGQIEFAQTHVVDVPRAIVDPLLVPGREALVIFTPRPLVPVNSISLVIASQLGEIVIPMAPPSNFPQSATFDQEHTFSGKPIVGEYPNFRSRAYTATIPSYFFNAENDFRFYINDNAGVTGSLNKNKTVFLGNQSEGLVLMNIKGCLFRPEGSCRTALDQFDMSSNPELAKIAAREMYSELPIKKLILGMGQSYWPYIIAKGVGGVYRYSTNEGERPYGLWASYGDATLPAKAGMGSFWRAASNLGNKQPGKFVAISGQLLDVPNDIPVLPYGVAASCGANSCNYPTVPDGYWHETGHGLGLPHDTPPRYENWAYRSYDLHFLPSYHPNPQLYDLPVDYLGYHYFGHVMGSMSPPKWPQWPGATASAPLVEEFETLRVSNPPAVAQWKRYIAPYTHQQMLRVQQRFGEFPPGLVYADITDDHRPTSSNTKRTTVNKVGQGKQAPIDEGVDGEIHDMGLVSEVEVADENLMLSGVPVHTLVVTMAAATEWNDSRKISQIYPPIVSNYGNVYKPAPVQSTANSDAPSILVDGLRVQSAKTGKCLTSRVSEEVMFDKCQATDNRQRWSQIGLTADGHFQLSSVGDGRCLGANLRLTACMGGNTTLWTGREDITGSAKIWKLQVSANGRFITPGANNTVTMEAIGGAEQILFSVPPDALFSTLKLHIQYANGTDENWVLYSAWIPTTEVITTAINIASERNPLYAELIRDEQVIDKRMLDKAPSLPPPIIVGGDAGYPTILYQYLRSEATGQCLTRTPSGLTQAFCGVSNAQQKWNLFDVLSVSGPKFILAGDSTAKCLDNEYAFNDCGMNMAGFQWSARKDLAPSGTVMLQNSADGRFMTAGSNGSVGQNSLTGGAEQNFAVVSAQQLAPAIRVKSIAASECIARVGEAVALATCSNDVTQQWLRGAIKNTETGSGPHFALVSHDGSRCLLDGLAMASCDVNAVDQHWSGRSDLADPGTFKLQSFATGTFIRAASYAPLVKEANQNDPHQLFELSPF